MREYLVTDFLDIENNIKLKSKKYLEIPVFDKNLNLDKNIIFYEKWNNYQNKLKDLKKNYKLYKFYLKKLTKFLNKYHQKKFSNRYWEIIIGRWLFSFITSISFKWNLIKNVKNKRYIFLKKKINSNDIIPHGIEDFSKLAESSYWNHYHFARIIEYGFSKKIYIKQSKNFFENKEKKNIYKKLQKSNLKENLSLIIQKIFNFLPQNKDNLIFSTYMDNFQDIKLNLLSNKSLLFYKSPRPYFFFRNKNLYKSKRKNFNIPKKGNPNLIDFLNVEILNNIPTAFLENYDLIKHLVNKIPFPKKPKKIFTCLGINRSTLMNRYIAENVERGATLILAQHGGNYFQHKNHFDTIHETNISDKFLSWGTIKKKNVFPIGVIKDLKKGSKNKIILEVRSRKPFDKDIKIDSGFFEGKKYLNNLCTFFKLIRNCKISNDLVIKLKDDISNWKEKKLFDSANPDLTYLNRSKKMVKEISDAKLIIHTYCSSGHLECLAANKPTLILYVHNFNLLEKKTMIYFKKFEKLGILHTSPQSLFNKLKKIQNSKEIEEWWSKKNIQNLLKKYRKDYCFLNEKKLINLYKLINYG